MLTAGNATNSILPPTCSLRRNLKYPNIQICSSDGKLILSFPMKVVIFILVVLSCGKSFSSNEGNLRRVVSISL